jgi:hypothetical protein
MLRQVRRRLRHEEARPSGAFNPEIVSTRCERCPVAPRVLDAGSRIRFQLEIDEVATDFLRRRNNDVAGGLRKTEGGEETT